MIFYDYIFRYIIAKKISYKKNNVILNFNKKRLGYEGNIKFRLKYAI